MGRWVNTRVFRKKAMGIAYNGDIIQLKNYTSSVAWENERMFCTPNEFLYGYFRGDLICLATPMGHNNHRITLDLVLPMNNDANHGRVFRHGEWHHSNTRIVLYSGTFYGFTFTAKLNNRQNGIWRSCGYNIFAANNHVGQYIVFGDETYMNNFQVAHLNYSGWTGEIVIEPINTIQYVLGYEPFHLLNFVIWTQPIKSMVNNFKCDWLAVEGDL